MANPPELWTFVTFNLLVLLFGGVLSAFSYLTYVRKGSEQFRQAALGFALVTAGGLTEAVYQFGAKGSHSLGARELLAVQSVEGLLIALGLGVLFYSIYTFTPRRPETVELDDPDDWDL
ncbi:MAG: hypothetical protein ABEI39_03760 [Halobacteriales archaeon]